MNEGMLLGLGLLGLLWLATSRSGIRTRPWREALVSLAFALALWLVLREWGVFDPSTSVFVAFLAVAIIESLWLGLARRQTGARA